MCHRISTCHMMTRYLFVPIDESNDILCKTLHKNKEGYLYFSLSKIIQARVKIYVKKTLIFWKRTKNTETRKNFHHPYTKSVYVCQLQCVQSVQTLPHSSNFLPERVEVMAKYTTLRLGFTKRTIPPTTFTKDTPMATLARHCTANQYAEKEMRNISDTDQLTKIYSVRDDGDKPVSQNTMNSSLVQHQYIH